LAKGHWPAYVTEREHRRITAQLAGDPSVRRCRPREAYLFAGLARCGCCGSSMHADTGKERKDGSRARRYVCTSHARDCSADACPARPIDADMVEAMFVDAMPVLFRDDPGLLAVGVLSPRSLSSPSQSDERQHAIDAARAGDELAFDKALALLLAQMSPKTAVSQQLAARSRRTRRREVLGEFHAWAAIDFARRTDESRQEALRLGRLLQMWLSAVAIAMDPRSVSIIAYHQSTETEAPRQDSVSFRRSEWRRYSQIAHRTSNPHFPWRRPEIIAALQQWAEAHGQTPRASEWAIASFEHPNAHTVRRHFASWRRALRAAGLKPANPQAVRVWTDEAIIRVLKSWADQHGRPPRADDWICGTPRRPCRTTVYNHFGTWSAALPRQASSLAWQRPESTRLVAQGKRRSPGGNQEVRSHARDGRLARSAPVGTFFLLAWQKPLLPRTNPRDGASLDVGLAHSTGASAVWVSTLTGVSRGRHPHPVASSMTHRLFITASLAASGAAVMRLGTAGGRQHLGVGSPRLRTRETGDGRPRGVPGAVLLCCVNTKFWVT
jgi:hypothetical protein